MLGILEISNYLDEITVESIIIVDDDIIIRNIIA
jgi:hypothetical protein